MSKNWIICLGNEAQLTITPAVNTLIINGTCYLLRVLMHTSTEWERGMIRISKMGKMIGDSAIYVFRRFPF